MPGIGWISFGAGSVGGLLVKRASAMVAEYTAVKKAQSLAATEIINFSRAAAEHMTEPARAVPLDALISTIIRSKAYPDPQGSAARYFYSTIVKNGKRIILRCSTIGQAA